jgi:UDP-N-acetylglucosamine--N-acetylmuramyl-(pentapeptide) pyrophosphoryl-undecaprenol N-acetylglucosamine transferase
VKDGYQRAGVKAAVLPYIHDMAGAYAAADLVVSRAGATTVAELAVCGKRAVLVPYPFAADNHQEHNARSLAERGGGEVIVQKDLTPSKLAAVIQRYTRGEGGTTSPLPSTAAEEIVRACKHHVQKD